MSTLPATLTQFKREVKVGDAFVCTAHWQESVHPGRYVGVTRTITQTQGNGYHFRHGDDPKRYWSPYPLARLYRVEGVGLRFGDDQKWWTLQPVGKERAA